MSINSKKPSIHLLITAILVVITLALASTYVIALVYANIIASSTSGVLAAWAREGAITDQSEPEILRNRLKRALTMAPDNPEYLERLARYYQWRSTQYKPESSENLEASQLALDYYTQAIGAVPSWPYYWSGLIQLKHALWQYDDEMERAIQNAARYGPWFDNNQNIILLAGFQGWPYLSQASRDSVIQVLENALKLQPKRVITQSLDNGYSSYLLPIINKDQELKSIYIQELIRRKRLL